MANKTVPVETRSSTSDGSPRWPVGSNGPTVATRLRNALADEARGPVYRAVLAHWMDTRTDPGEMADAVQLAVDVELKEGCRTAVRVETMTSWSPPSCPTRGSS